MEGTTGSRDVELDHKLILQAWACVIGENQISYLSGPITTGQRWVEAVENGGDEKALSDVITQNSFAIRETARELRAKSPRLVLEPASLNVVGWSQADYLKLWTTLIERHADEVLFMPGWAYSIGCALEFERALDHEISTRTVEGAELSRDAGLKSLGGAAANLLGRQRGSALEALGHRISEVVERIGGQLASKRAAIA